MMLSVLCFTYPFTRFSLPFCEISSLVSVSRRTLTPLDGRLDINPSASQVAFFILDCFPCGQVHCFYRLILIHACIRQLFVLKFAEYNRHKLGFGEKGDEDERWDLTVPRRKGSGSENVRTEYPF